MKALERPLRASSIYLSRMRGREVSPPRKPWSKIVWSGIGGFAGIFAVSWLSHQQDLWGGTGLFLIGSFGASAPVFVGTLVILGVALLVNNLSRMAFLGETSAH